MSEDRLRGALGAWVTSGFDDRAIDEEMYLNDPVYHSVVWQARALFEAAARKSGNSVAETRFHLSRILSENQTPTMQENLRRQMFAGWSEDPVSPVTPRHEGDK